MNQPNGVVITRAPLNTHTESDGRRKKQRQDKTKQATFRGQIEPIEGEHSFSFHVKDHATQHHDNPKGLLVDTGVTSHLVTTDKFTSID